MIKSLKLISPKVYLSFLFITVCCISVGYGAEPDEIDVWLDNLIMFLDDMLMMAAG